MRSFQMKITMASLAAFFFIAGTGISSAHKTGGGTPTNWFNYGGYCSFQIGSGEHLCLSAYDLSNSTTYYVQFVGK